MTEITPVSQAEDLSSAEPISPPPPSKSKLRPRQTLNRLVLGLTGVGMALGGQYFFGREALAEGLIFFAIGLVLFVVAFGRRYTFGFSPSRVSHLKIIHTGWRRNVGVWLILLALGASLLTFSFFGNDDGRTQAWWLYVVEIALLIGGVWILTPTRRWRPLVRCYFPQNYVSVLLLLIVFGALALRLYRFDSQPAGIWYDEAEAGIQARRILSESSYRPILYPPINVTGHLLGLYALALQWFGDSISSMRLVSVAFGVGTVLLAYLFGRDLRGP
ncbi:MAG: hypothetical protein R3264_22990, partial [Anaerolineae bacterium]|nr:hypothetical protein [Anaerolineae bacterium]